MTPLSPMRSNPSVITSQPYEVQVTLTSFSLVVISLSLPIVSGNREMNDPFDTQENMEIWAGEPGAMGDIIPPEPDKKKITI